MKLYFSPGACSFAPHIVLLEAGITHQIDKVDLRTKQFSGGDFREVNPKGSVPVIELDNGQRLTETAAILQYLADLKPEKQLAPPPGTWERVRLQEWLNYVSSEIHKTFSLLFGAGRMVPHPEGGEQFKAYVKEALAARFVFLNSHFENHPFLMGAQFTVPDAYLFTCLRWSKVMGIDLAQWPALSQYKERVGERPAVKQAMQAEGLKI